MSVDASVQAELDALLLPWDDVSTRRMFGGLGYFVGDRLFAAFHRGNLATKLPDADYEKALAHPGARPFTPTPGRRFGTWVEFSLEHSGGAEPLLPWLKTAFEYVQQTPPTGKRTSRRKQ